MAYICVQLWLLCLIPSSSYSRLSTLAAHASLVAGGVEQMEKKAAAAWQCLSLGLATQVTWTGVGV